MSTPLAQQLSRPSRWPSPGQDASSRLALDLAMGIKNPKAIADDYGMPHQELVQRIQTDKAFARQVSEYRRIWLSPTNAAERVRIKAAVLAEDGLMEVWALIVDDTLNPSVRLDAHKHISKLADVEPRREDAQSGPTFSLTLNLGGDATETIVMEQTQPEPLDSLRVLLNGR